MLIICLEHNQTIMFDLLWKNPTTSVKQSYNQQIFIHLPQDYPKIKSSLKHAGKRTIAGGLLMFYELKLKKFEQKKTWFFLPDLSNETSNFLYRQKTSYFNWEWSQSCVTDPLLQSSSDVSARKIPSLFCYFQRQK